MKLRNKKTGEIEEIKIYKTDKYGYRDDFSSVEGENSLADFNEEWEDYEEPKGIQCIDYVNHFDAVKIDGVLVSFDNREEAELAVRKLKAWKRLKDKGFRFVRIDEQNEGHRVGQYIEFEMAYHFTPDARQIGYDLDLLFSGEND